MPETPYTRYEYPEEDEVPWHRKGVTRDGNTLQWDGRNDILEQQELEITDEVATWADLPDPDPAAQTKHGQRRTIRVRDPPVTVRDVGSEWVIIGGIGGPDQRLSPMYTEGIDATDASVETLSADSATVTDVESTTVDSEQVTTTALSGLSTETIQSLTGDGIDVVNGALTASTGTSDGGTDLTDWGVIDVSNHGFPGDQTGGDLAQFVADNTVAGGRHVFVLPDGTYNWERPVQFTGGTGTNAVPQPESIAIVGEPEATLHVDIPDTAERLCFRFGSAGNGVDELHLESIHFDVGDQSDQRDAGIMRAYIAEQALIEDVTLSARKRLQADGTTNGDRFCIQIDCVNEDATAVMRRVRFPEGDVFQGSEFSVGHAIPLAAEDSHVGTNRWIDCYLEGFVDNGFYMRDGPGSNILVGCTAKNCSAGQFRLGRNDRARDITAITTASCEYNSTPLWIEEFRDTVPEPTEDYQDQYVPGDEDDSPVVVSGFELLAEGGPVNDVIRVTRNPPEVRLEGGYIRCRSDDYILDQTANTGKVSLRDVTIDDHATGTVRQAAIHASGDNVVLDNVTYRADPPSGESGRSLFWADGCDRFLVKDCDLQCTNFPLIEGESGSEFRMIDSVCENSATDAYLLRLQSMPLEYLNLRYNDVRDYMGLGASTADINQYHIVGNRGLTDQTSS